MRIDRAVIDADRRGFRWRLTETQASAGRYVSMATPVLLVVVSTSFKAILGLPSGKSRFPLPSTMGSIHSS